MSQSQHLYESVHKLSGTGKRRSFNTTLLTILFLAALFVVLTFPCELSEETLVSQQDAQNPAGGKGCLLTSSVKGVSKADRLHKYAVSTTSAKTDFYSRSCPTHTDIVTGNPVATL